MPTIVPDTRDAKINTMSVLQGIQSKENRHNTHNTIIISQHYNLVFKSARRTQRSEQSTHSNLHMCKPSRLNIPILLFCFSFNAFLYVALHPLGKYT